MGRPSKRTPIHDARVKAMHAKGASAREISEAVGVSPQAVVRWLRAMGLEPRGGAGAREKRPRVEVDVEGKIREAERLIVADAVDGAGGIEPLRKNLADVQRLLANSIENLKSGSMSPNLYSSLLRIQTQMLTDLAALEPKKPVDPDQDPVNLDLAAQVTRKLRVLVEEEEKKARKKGGSR